MTENITVDFKKWVAYSVDLKSLLEVQNLYNAVRLTREEGNVTCDEFKENENVYYIVRVGSSDPLKINNEDCVAFLSYLSLHYFKPETVAVGPHKSNYQDDVGETFQVELPKKTLIGKLLSPNTFTQAFRFSIVAILIFQGLLISEYVFDLDIPTNATMAFSFILLMGLSYISVNLYKKHFAEEVRFRFVSRLTIMFCVLVYVEYSVELNLIDILKGDNSSLFARVVELFLYMSAGLFIGLVFSVINFIFNGDKMISRPGKA